MHEAINGWTKQSIIKHIEDNFKGKSIDSTGDNCMYRGIDGRKCAIGLFIPDSLYDAKIEKRTVIKAIELIPELEMHMPLSLDSHALSDFQDIHDSSSPDKTKNKLIQWVEKNVE